MAEFLVTVKDKEGRKLNLKRTASEKGELVEEMHRDGLFVIQITDAVSGRSGERRSGFTGKALPWRKRGIKVKGDLLVSFTRQLATMVSAGLPLIKIMRGLASEQEPKFGEVLRQVSEDVEQGSTFSEALRKQPRVFNQLFTALVESGEESGQLDVILDQLADYMEATRDIRMRVKSALRYPMFIFSFIGLIVVVFILKVIPKFAQIYEGFNAQLPLPTQMVMNFSALVRQNILFIFLLIGVIVVGVKLLVRTERGGFAWDKLKLRLPIIGKIAKKVVVSRLARTLSVLAHSGMPIVQALSVVRRAANNKIYEQGIVDTKRRVEEGQTLTEAMQGTGVFPELLIQMVSTGEETGTMGQMLAHVADFYEKQVKASVDGIVSLIEPAVIIALGGVVGGIIMVMYLPIFKLGMVLR